VWKRLSRLWKNADAVEGSTRDMRLARASVAPGESRDISESAGRAPAQTDPMLLPLERYDQELRECGADSVVALVRELVHAAPTDPRVLRRAAALSRELGDEGLAQGFDQAATSSSGEPLADLGHAFLGMDDSELALALGDGAIARASVKAAGGDTEAHERSRRGRVRRGESTDDGGDEGLAAGRLVGALALSRLGEHAQVLERLAGALDDGIATRVRWALAALALGDIAAWQQVAGQLGPAEAWIDEVRARVEAFPSADEGYSSDPQRPLFALYGTILLDDASEGERLEPKRLARWMDALATLVRELLPPGTRPAWVSPRGEVLARWLGSCLEEEGAIPLSARLPKQSVLVVLADDADLATLVETRAWLEGELPTFQAIKDPGEVGSPMADVIGVFRADIALPLEGLEAERAVDRLPPRMLLGRLQDEAKESRGDASELDGFLAWVRARAELLTLPHPPGADARIPLDVAREF